MTQPTQILPLTETTTPDDQAEVAEIVGRAYELGTPLYPIGGGTGLGYGLRPSQPGLGLSLSRLSRVVDYPARDLTVTVEAGVTIAQLANHLAAERQRVPVDIPQADRATAGGAVAASPSGPRRYRYGTLRDYVIGVRAVDGRGTAFSGGGRVVKNAAGYDLCRLLCGSLGTLGVITQVTLMVKPTPETSAMLACDVSDLDEAERLVAGLVHTQTVPAAIELLAGPAWQDDPALAAGSPSCIGRLVVGFEGTPAEVDWMIRRLDAEWQAAGGICPTPVTGDDAVRVWSRLTDGADQEPRSDGSESLVVRIGVLPSKTVAFIQRLWELDPTCSIQAHAGDGILRARFSREPREMAAALRDRLRPAVTNAGGWLVVLSYPGDLQLSRDDVWGPPTEAAKVTRRIKAGFDPKGILNPGRFVFGNR